MEDQPAEQAGDNRPARRFMTDHSSSLLLTKGHDEIRSLEEYRAGGGLKGLDQAGKLSSKRIIAHVKNAALRGRGGAGFPTGVKWGTVADAECATKYVVCNAAEGEPGTYKDRYLIQKNPYQLIEGILIACQAVNAEQAVIGIKDKFRKEVKRLEHAIREFEQENILPKGAIEIFKGPDDYLFGEEKGLMEAIDGRGALPRILPPYTLGIRESPDSPNPTAVNNVETLSHVPNIFADGPERFLSIGCEDNGGTMLFTLTGDVKRPGMYELPLGTPLKSLIFEHGQGPSGKHKIKAVFSGAANAVITPDQFETPMDFDSMKGIGSGLGSGGFIVYDESACMVKAALMFSSFLSQASCGQCVPCVNGTQKITDWLHALEQGDGDQSHIDRILDECTKVTNQSRCYLPAQESNLVPSVIKYFDREFKDHVNAGCSFKRRIETPQIERFDPERGEFIFG